MLFRYRWTTCNVLLHGWFIATLDANSVVYVKIAWPRLMGNFVTGVQLAASILLLYGMRSDGILSAAKCRSNFFFLMSPYAWRGKTWGSDTPNYFTDCLQTETEDRKLWEIAEKLPYLFGFEQITIWLTILTPWSTVLLEKLTDSQLSKKFSVFYGTWRLITAFTRARHFSSPRKLWMFRKMAIFYVEEELLTLRLKPSWRTTPCWLSATAYSIHSQLPSTLEALPLSV